MNMNTDQVDLLKSVGNVGRKRASEMTHEEYEKAKIELKEKKWKLKHLTGSDSFTQHVKMHIDLLEAIISKHEDCYHVNKPVIQNLLISTEVLK